jgi:recombination protein RecR
MLNSYPETLQKLITGLSKLPGIGEKTATRLSLYLLSKPEMCELLGDLIKALPFRVKLCKYCRNFAEEDVCKICKDNQRDSGLLCIVENPVNLAKIEETGIFNGYYFVLHYLLSPKDGIGPKELGLEHLLWLISTRKVREVIIALSPTLSGEATATYIYKILKDYPVKVSKLACGIPMGMEVQFVDSLTLKKAINSREVLKDE